MYVMTYSYAIPCLNIAQNVEVITDDGAPSGRRDFLVWNPPLKDPMEPSLGRHSAISESTKLMRYLMKKGVRTILFCKVYLASTCDRLMHLLTCVDRFEKCVSL